MNIITSNVDSDTLSAEKRVRTDTKQIETPAKALQVGKLRASEDVSPVARGIAEIYIKANGTGLENSRGRERYAGKLRRQSKRAEDDEFVIPFVQFEEEGELTEEHATEIAKLQTNYGDILPVPLMTPLVNEADDGDGPSDPPVSTILENTRVFLEAVDDLNIGKPVMAVIPPISKECTNALLDQYVVEYDLRAYCVDFNRRSPMAETQLDSVDKPLMRTLERYDIRDSSLLYAVNANESRRVTDARQTPGVLYAYTLGFDVVGDKHLPPRYPPEVFEDMESTTDLRLFEADTLSVVEVPPEELESFLPDEAEIPVERVRQRIAKDHDEKFRFEKLINAELIELYLDADGGVDVQEIYTALRGGSFTQESDLERVQELVADVSSEGA